MNIRTWAAVASVALGGIGCDAAPRSSGDGGVNHAVLHPIMDELASHSGAAPVIEVSFQSLLGAFPAYLDALARFEDTEAVGVLTGPSEFLFGSIGDAAVDPDGRVLLLDRAYGVVRILSADLEPLALAGALGDGPGEFVRPVGIVTTEQPGRFGVIDEEGMRIEWFGPDPEGGFASAGRTPLPIYTPTSACIQQDRLLVQGIRARAGTISQDDSSVFAETIHEVNESGEVERSFSAPYSEVNDWIVAFQVLRAELVCTSETVWVAYSELGEVHAMEPDGTRRWIVRIGDLDHPGFLQEFRVDGSWAFGMNLDAEEDQAIELITGIELVADDVLAVQVLFSRRSGMPEENPFGTLLLNAHDGSPLGAFLADHRVLGAGAGRAVLYRSHPFPQVAVALTAR